MAVGYDGNSYEDHVAVPAMHCMLMIFREFKENSHRSLANFSEAIK